MTIAGFSMTASAISYEYDLSLIHICITSSGALNPTKYGLRGPGVYSGTTPTPSWALKHIPYSGWGLGNAPVRIPIKINPNMPVEYVNWPFKTAIFRTGSEPLKLCLLYTSRCV